MRYAIGDIVRVPLGAVGIVTGRTHLGSVLVRLPLVGMTFPYHGPDLVSLMPWHDPSGRGCALAGRARAGHDVPWSDVCGRCYLEP